MEVPSVAAYMGRRASHQGWTDHPITTDEVAPPAPVCEGPIKITPIQPTTTATTLRETGENVFACKFSPDGLYIAATYGNGAVRIFEDSTSLPLTCVHRFKAHQTYQASGTGTPAPEPQPVTSVKWRPHCPSNYELLTTESEGSVYQWTWNPQGKEGETHVEHLAKQLEKGNEPLCSEYSPDGNTFVTGGSDRVIRVYDTLSGRCQAMLTAGIDDMGKSRATHTNRIFSVRFVNPNVLISAGWESAIQVWDVRISKSIRQFGGTRVCGDSLDVNPNTTQVIVACYRPQSQIMLFDYLSGREIPNRGIAKALGESHLYGARLGADQRTLWCLGAKPNEVTVLDIQTGEVRAKVRDIHHSLFSIQLDPKNPNTRAVLGGFNDTLFMAELTQ